MKDTPIASDDPLAAIKLQERIEQLERLQASMKQANAIVRKHAKTPNTGAQALVEQLGFEHGRALSLFTPDFCGRIGFAGFELTNNNANIRRLKERLTSVQEHANDVTSEEQINGCTITDNVEAHRVQITFQGKPAENIRAFLKSYGFKWAPSLAVWQQHRSSTALAKAREAVAMLTVAPIVNDLAVRFAGCVEEFRTEIYALANQAGKDVLDVYTLWLDYAKSVSGEGGQSALLSEFRQWYAKELAPVKTIWNSDGLDEPALISLPPQQ